MDTYHPCFAAIPVGGLRRMLTKPLRTHSLLHIAAARGNIHEIEANLAAGVPINLLAGDGLAPLHWALTRAELSTMEYLLSRGSQVDVRSDEGATPLMTEVQMTKDDTGLEKIVFLLDHGADVNAQDGRGFTALHRAAELGSIRLVRLLLARGAVPHPEAQGHTPRSLAEAGHHTEIVKLLS